MTEAQTTEAPVSAPPPAAAPTAPAPTSIESLHSILASMQAATKRDRVPSLETRLTHLDKLERAVIARKEEFARAVAEDWGHRSRHETIMSDIFTVVKAARYARAHLAEWLEPEERDVDMTFFPARAEVVYQPLGVVGIIAPWNYPVQLALVPLVDALAAGNRAMIKPSELVPRTAALLATLVAETFAPDHVAVITGEQEVAVEFGKLAFDHLIFTGSTRVGKLVMRAAAENLVPVTLELGGKSPAILGERYSMSTFAESMVGGKLFNAGQTCIAPDYVIVPKGKSGEFASAFEAAVKKHYTTLIANTDYSSIANAPHKKRLKELVADAESKGAKVVVVNPASENDEGSPKLLPTLVLDAKPGMTVMEEEIFGPVLPVIEADTLDAAIEFVNERPRPLALYYFDRDNRRIDKVLAETISGGVSINDTMYHQVQESLPFGGVGPSGMGHYHGRDGFITLSKKKPVFHQSRLNGANMIRPPYGKTIEFAMRMLVGK